MSKASQASLAHSMNWMRSFTGTLRVCAFSLRFLSSVRRTTSRSSVTTLSVCTNSWLAINWFITNYRRGESGSLSYLADEAWSPWHCRCSSEDSMRESYHHCYPKIIAVVSQTLRSVVSKYTDLRNTQSWMTPRCDKLWYPAPSRKWSVPWA